MTQIIALFGRHAKSAIVNESKLDAVDERYISEVDTLAEEATALMQPVEELVLFDTGLQRSRQTGQRFAENYHAKVHGSSVTFSPLADIKSGSASTRLTGEYVDGFSYADFMKVFFRVFYENVRKGTHNPYEATVSDLHQQYGVEASHQNIERQALSGSKWLLETLVRTDDRGQIVASAIFGHGPGCDIVQATFGPEIAEYLSFRGGTPEAHFAGIYTLETDHGKIIKATLSMNKELFDVNPETIIAHAAKYDQLVSGALK